MEKEEKNRKEEWMEGEKGGMRERVWKKEEEKAWRNGKAGGKDEVSG